MVRELISVIIPVYNTEAWLETAVRGVLRQSYTELEMILVDDGSTDGSAALCEALAAQDPRIRLIRQPNGGVSRARNTGLDAASGRFIVFIDSDDWIEEEYLETLMREREAQESTLCVCGFAEHRGEKTVLPTEGQARKRYAARDFLLATLREENGLRFSSCGWLIPAEPAKRERFAEGMIYGEDALYICCLLKQAASVAFAPDTLYHYRMERDGNTLTRRSLDRTKQILSAWEQMAAVFGEEDEEIRAEFARILTDVALQAARQAAAEGKSDARKEMTKKARESFRAVRRSPFISKKTKLRLQLLLLFPSAGPRLWEKLKGARP